MTAMMPHILISLLPNGVVFEVSQDEIYFSTERISVDESCDSAASSQLNETNKHVGHECLDIGW